MRIFVIPNAWILSRQVAQKLHLEWRKVASSLNLQG